MITIHKTDEKELKKKLGKALNKKEKSIEHNGLKLDLYTVKSILNHFYLGYDDFTIYNN